MNRQALWIGALITLMAVGCCLLGMALVNAILR